MIEMETENSLDIFPNPCSEYLYLKGNQIENIEIIDLFGRKLSAIVEISDNQCRLDISGFCDGIYIILIKIPNGILARKVYKISPSNF
jgi:hypothetical protein